MSSDSGVTLKTLKVDGGMIQSDVLAQFQADVLSVNVVRPSSLEATAAGMHTILNNLFCTCVIILTLHRNNYSLLTCLLYLCLHFV